ncbi:hypothetical protein PGQ11_002556 [Apiospora arundinis]|uniref:Uncharacterized protein n=1 Tax=Apiospora arundinis TaxID=335852 RepID=A0ABR2JIH2_9PEZI
MAAVIANDRLPEDTSESAKETLALLEPFLTAWRDGDPQGMFARIADGQVDYIDYCQQITHTVLSPQKLETKEAIRPFLKGFFQIASDFTYTTVAAYGDRCQLTVEAVISVTL